MVDPGVSWFRPVGDGVYVFGCGGPGVRAVGRITRRRRALLPATAGALPPRGDTGYARATAQVTSRPVVYALGTNGPAQRTQPGPARGRRTRCRWTHRPADRAGRTRHRQNTRHRAPRGPVDRIRRGASLSSRRHLHQQGRQATPRAPPRTRRQRRGRCPRFDLPQPRPLDGPAVRGGPRPAAGARRFRDPRLGPAQPPYARGNPPPGAVRR